MATVIVVVLAVGVGISVVWKVMEWGEQRMQTAAQDARRVYRDRAVRVIPPVFDQDREVQ